ncbi:MAG: aminotransferase class V-fold PLP-dependent enzyme [Gemmatimonadetes bacterium]|uniref:Aminotransferase class V-fold PLP-dependent enzyme n=1 Tax=Candidatus Kutchimonas denitrificans TaxID=3056748 RepID=A0AAE4ZAL4_9BACT|nr:aminotransferase class V-fold PLP-dependent enzyme [Gemmatimonadota bacterium]NIR76123.1 aminotransferase class V-fold PLP-dependent enzyme [Candidatus Kutchimonas denitrificans]NIS00502.1 aminotransferase class V-fold PLP-dependent enzyme [Gemmatimonadota bacterium]NIT66160.1 aminotransferase class V-fold PLP-dependent enzyme [Gemmatimonadota bacterium]NIU54238.1 aminotransferase class V-fold PLP-dependent enzyme [Gemmatimonadota bacterium]
MTGNAVNFDVETLRRSEFPEFDERGSVYLNSASVGPLPRRTRRALQEFSAEAGAPDHRVHEYVEEIPATARRLCARLIGARPHEIALGANTTFGLALAASALPVEPGDTVLLLDGEFPANVYPWLNRERDGVRIEFVPRDERGLPNESAALERIERGDVRIFAASLVNFVSGFRLDLEAISRACRRHGTYLVIDGIQAVGAVPVDVSAVDVDMLACGGQKWLLSPNGVGFVYVREGLIGELDPATVGWLSFKATQNFEELLDYQFEPLDDARRFELGSLPFYCLRGLSESLSLLLELGVPAIEKHVRKVQAKLTAWVESRRDVDWVSDPSPARRSGILSFRVPDPAFTDARLRESGITVSVREGAVRAATHAFNTWEDIERLTACVESTLD